ncbi:Bacteriophage T4-like capsid assembly protein (Gp20) [uncultured archaeon]|nr:Bacteriophage T4-like capsid assembly protein (Gp20) [uncultured archaeon]
MPWRRYFKASKSIGNLSALSLRGGRSNGLDSGSVLNYPNSIQESYMGCPNRIERYQNYELMSDDSEICAALDILSEFSTQTEENDPICFNIKYKEPPTETESKIIRERLFNWYRLNKLDIRMFKIFRNVLKYGDQVFLRDPETFKLFYVEMDNVIKVIVNESRGKLPEQYVIRNINPNFENLTVTQVSAQDMYNVIPSGPGYVAPTAGFNMPNSPYSSNSRFVHGNNEHTIEAKNILHVSLTEGLDPNWPFGTSVLESVFKVFKQKELLEDSIVIYRVQRAPDRRVFNIDVGDMPSHLAMAYIERLKNEIHQRRIPTHGDGQHFMDSTYFPMPVQADFFFPKNSAGKGTTVDQLSGGCLAMDTKIPLLDGRILSLTELTKEFQGGKENWIYSCYPKTGAIAPGLISWAGITHESAKVMKLTFDSGKELVCTLDHKFPIIGKGFVEAQNIQLDDSFVSFNTRLKEICASKKRDINKYQQVWDHERQTWLFTHRVVANFMRKLGFQNEMLYDEKYRNVEKHLIHHKDFNRYNNNPSNLAFMNRYDHALYHTKGPGFWGNTLTDAQKEARKKKLSKKTHEYFDSLAPEARKERLVNFEKGKKKYIKTLTSSPKLLVENAERSRRNMNHYIEKHPEFLAKLKQIADEGRVPIKSQKHQFSQEIFDYILKFVNRKLVTYGKMRKKDILTLLRNDQKLLKLYADANPKTGDFVTSDVDYTIFNDKKMLRFMQWFHIRYWKNLVEMARNYNHKLVSIEYLSDPITVGTLTIDQEEKYHNYHTFALECGVFTKNSNLGEINDLLFFNNKMIRALRIPSSYLPTGPEDSNAGWNDGRTGTALIQEFRFNQYCQRLQRLICSPFDLEFKAYLKWCGINIDSSSFQLQFKPPQNFAHYRQVELDAAKIGVFGQLEQTPYFSKRFLMKRYLGMTEDEIAENQKLWREENRDGGKGTQEPVSARNIGISPGGIQTDMNNFGPEMPEMGAGENPNEPIPTNAPRPAEAGAPAAESVPPSGPQPEF